MVFYSLEANLRKFSEKFSSQLLFLERKYRMKNILTKRIICKKKKRFPTFKWRCKLLQHLQAYVYVRFALLINYCQVDNAIKYFVLLFFITLCLKSWFLFLCTSILQNKKSFLSWKIVALKMQIAHGEETNRKGNINMYVGLYMLMCLRPSHMQSL